MELDKISIEKLVDYLTKEVAKNLNLDKVKKDKVLIANEKESKIEIKSDKFEILYLNEIEELNIDDFKHVIVPSFTLNQLNNISIGKSEDKITSTIIEGILKGKEIFILNDGVEYRQYKESSNENFYNMIEDYEKKIISFGINFIDRKDIDLIGEKGEVEVKQVHNENNENNEKTYMIENKIITEGVLEKTHRRGHKDIGIKNNAIITPLAKDYIRINSINILKK